MTLVELEKSIADLRSRPLRLLCRTRRGKEKIMSLEECRRTGSSYIHVVTDDLDQLLSAELGGDSFRTS